MIGRVTLPTGALNAERLKLLKERMKQMKESGMPPFLYGTHYSAPGRGRPAHSTPLTLVCIRSV